MRKHFFLLIFLLPTSIFSQQDISLFQQFNGTFDFTAFGNTLNLADNSVNNICDILSSSSADFTLDPQFTLRSAYLYWAGSGPGDFEVKLNESVITPDRTFNVNSNGLPFFSAFAEVTSIISANTTGQYTLSELDLDVSLYCDNQTNFGGWSVVVIYEDPSLQIKRQVSVFDGLQFVDNNRPLDITLDFLSITDPQNAKIGFLTWEGDRGLSITEQLLVNGNVISDPPLNPSDNAFNSTNSYTGSDELYNMDMDLFSIQDFINANDTSAEIALTSGADFVMVNNIVASYHSEVDLDAIVEILDVTFCGGQDLIMDYKVTNQGTLGLLSANTPIAIYINNLLIAQTQTQTFLPSNQFENGSITIAIPDDISGSFSLKVVVDDNGTGMGIIDENNENNNEHEVQIQLPEAPEPVRFTICDTFDENDGIATFDLTDTTLINDILQGGDPVNFDITYYDSLENANSNVSPVPFLYTNTVNPEKLFARITNKNTNCFYVNEIILKVNLLPEFNLEDTYRLCVDMENNATAEEFGEKSPPVLKTGLSASLYEFVWTFDGTTIIGETNPQLVVLQSGNYSVTVLDKITGCDRSKNTVVTLSSAAFNIETEVITNAFSETHSIQVNFEGHGNYTFSLNNGRGQAENIFHDVQPGIHKVSVQDKNGCGTRTISGLAIIDYPRFVTPNQDGFNDTWHIKNLGNISPQAKIYIFDRYGKLLKELRPEDPGWDGIYKGNPLPSTDYWFRVNYMENGDFKEFRGHFTLKR